MPVKKKKKCYCLEHQELNHNVGKLLCICYFLVFTTIVILRGIVESRDKKENLLN